ncbi:endo-beta-1 like protein [Verticillium longisporum]|nr:endo-beta-1 like protein [Verticillium longisporum]
MRTAVVLGLLAPFAFGNYLFRSITVNGGRSANWEFVRETANNPTSNPIEDVSSPLLSCYEKIGRPVSDVQTVAPGTRIRFPSSAPIGHPGPVLFYLARVPDGQDVNSWAPTGNVWFKVDQYGNTPGVNTQFAVEMTEIFTTIPASLRPGNYLLRAEHIALHSYQKPQFSLACAQLQVTGSGPDFPESFVSFPGAYKADDAGLLFDIYTSTTNPYPYPGPAVWVPSTPPPPPPPTTTLVTRTTTAVPQPTGPVCARLWAQCGGQGFVGPTCCAAGTCIKHNQWFSTCLNS